METRIESESFEPLIGFLPFMVQKLLSKNNKLITGNYTGQQQNFNSDCSECP